MSASVSIFHRKGVRPNLFHQDSCPKSLVATTVKACVQHVPWPFQSGGDSNCRFGTTGWQVIRARRVNRLSMKINHNQILTWKSKKHKNHPTQIFNPPANIQKTTTVPAIYSETTDFHGSSDSGVWKRWRSGRVSTCPVWLSWLGWGQPCLNLLNFSILV